MSDGASRAAARCATQVAKRAFLPLPGLCPAGMAVKRQALLFTRLRDDDCSSLWPASASLARVGVFRPACAFQVLIAVLAGQG